MIRAGRVHKAGRAVLNADMDGEIAGVHIIVGVRFEGEGQLGVGVAIDQLGTEWGTGLAGPSRDMLIKRAAPPGATGRVYGTVYSGLDLGFCLAAPVFGYMLDHQMTNAVFYGSAIALVLSVVSAVIVGDGVSKKTKSHLAAA